MSISRKRGGLGFRMEDADQQAMADNQDDGASLAVDVEAAGAVDEADMVGDAVAEHVGDIDASVEAVEELNEVLPAMAEAAADDGFTAREAENVQARLEKIAEKAGIDFQGTGLVMRRENFGTQASRKTQTKMRLEAATGMFTKIWENIKAGWQWLKDQLSNFWNKWTGNAEGIKKRLNDLQGRVTNLPAGAKAKDSRLKAKAAFFSVNRNTTPDTIKSVIASVKGMETAASQLRNTLGGKTVESLKGEGATVAAAGAAFATEVVEALKSTVGAAGNRDRSTLARSFKDGESKGDVTDVIGVLPGGRALVIEKMTSTSGSATAEISKVSLDVVEDQLADDYEAPKDKAELNYLVNAGLDMINSLIKSTKTKAEVEEAISRVMSGIDSISKEATAYANSDKNNENDDLRNNITVKTNILKAMQSVAKALVSQTPKMMFDTAAALADMAAAGVSNMKDEKK